MSNLDVQANVPEGLPATVTSCLTVCAQVTPHPSSCVQTKSILTRRN